jgi:electron transfer flavoprotein beta subunit
MNILVCVKQVPDTETKIKLGGSGIDTAGIKWIMNPYDEFAVEEALKLKAAKPDTQVHVLTVGPKSRVVDALRTALAMGADEATVVDAPETLDSFNVAKAIANASKKMGTFGILLSGKSAIDDNNFSVGQMVAAFLDIPHATSISKADYTEKGALLEREIEGGAKEILEVEFPVMITANKGLNTPRYASLPGIMKAKKKVIQEMTLSDVGVDAGDIKVKYTNFELPPERPSVQMIAGEPQDQAQKLVQLLRQEAKVI